MIEIIRKKELTRQPESFASTARLVPNFIHFLAPRRLSPHSSTPSRGRGRWGLRGL